MKNNVFGKYCIQIFVLSVSIFFVSCVSHSKKGSASKGNPVGQEASKANTWVFLMAGQSNMAGRGAVEAQDTVTNKRILTINKGNKWILAKEPLHFYESSDALDCGMSFAKELLKGVPDSITIALVPCAVGGSSVFQWLNDEEHRGVKLLSNFRQKVQLAKQKGIIKGVLWHQGESNASKAGLQNYQNSLLQLLSKFRESVGNDTLPIIMGEIGRFAQPEEKAAYFEDINQIIRTVAADNDNLYFVSSEGLTDRGDHLHFNSASQRELGKRYADKFLSIQKSENKK
ncbi:sialate O-acetylesterase [uncultured Sunxiuqinia sp.]|uniref:sialate O-acetylesterase n=1 Tax=uncultured Sunxiuqinia sp. TaxID=1573825 RepID=UPI002AA8F530|nr:sialate O-acetylesterase [uncultured Sunxiuqinia sp.]